MGMIELLNVYIFQCIETNCIVLIDALFGVIVI